MSYHHRVPRHGKTRVEAGFCMLLLLVLGVAGCGSGATSTFTPPVQPPVPAVVPLVVNSLADLEQPPAGTTTLRSALAQAQSGQPVTFSPALDGGTIELLLVGEEHSILKGEVYAGMTYQGYAERDYGRSALYARKNVVIDASSLPNGIFVHWASGDANPARVLAVYGDLTLKNVFISGGYSKAEPLQGSQPYTLARGGGLAVWGTATLEDCAVSANRISGDLNGSRDRGAYGGGIYANGLNVRNCIISGNSAIGYGAAGGGIYSVGGADGSSRQGAVLSGCVISGNRVTAQHAYGGGLFTLAGGPEYTGWLLMTNCTVARNLVEDHPGIANVGQFYFRGGGIYMGGGSLAITASTIVENRVTGQLATFSGSPNMGGGGVAATIGNAHVVGDVEVQHSIVAGNQVASTAQDWYTGSLMHFISHGYNRFGVLDFSRMLVPVPEWMDLSRKHYPKAGDVDGIALSDAVAVDEAQHHASIQSVGTDAGSAVVLWYPPAAASLDQVPAAPYEVQYVLVGYGGGGLATDDFLNHVLLRIRAQYAATLGPDFGSGFGDLTGTTFHGPPVSWPTNPDNASWISFWRGVDTEIGGQLGSVGLGDDFWGTFTGEVVGNEVVIVTRPRHTVSLITLDQRGRTRPSGSMADIGAVEKTAD